MTGLKNSKVDTPLEQLTVSAYTVPTDAPEADGTYQWDSTTMVLVEIRAGDKTGLGFTYADSSTALLIKDKLAKVVLGGEAMAVPAAWQKMVYSIRNLGRPGIASMAISAVDAALWDLKARLLELPLVTLLGQCREAVPVYGSGGFTSYNRQQLQGQLGGWARQGLKMVKMKIGTHPEDDLERVRQAREAIGPQTQLFVDANGAYSRKQALAFAGKFSEYQVSWFEEPVSSDDLAGLRLIRDNAPPGINITAGEYGYDLGYFRRMLEAGAVDILQADATRCAGLTGFMRVSPLVESRSMRLSAHCAPSLHAHLGCALATVCHLEYFHDHARIEQMLFDGTLIPKDGALQPDLSRPGFGLEFKRAEAEKFRVTSF
jgi:L-alanine-DL-glutamate epimerase-like enolase superfamily enzyme